VSTNELHRVTVLLDYGASLEDHGRYEVPALHYAVRGGKLPLIKLLLQRGAQPNALDEHGLTPLLHLAKTRSKADPIPVMELLIDHGACVDARDESQFTLLMYFGAARQSRTGELAACTRRRPQRSEQVWQDSRTDWPRACGDRAVAHEIKRLKITDR
jgi:ankyrin repeat protein